MALKEILHMLEPLWRQKKEAADPQQKTSTIVMADRETDVVADDSADSRGNHHAKQIEFIRVTRGEISTDEQDCLSGDRQTCVFEHHAEENRPITVNQHVVLYEVERVVKEIHYRQAARTVLGDSNWAVRDEQGWIQKETRLESERLS